MDMDHEETQARTATVRCEGLWAGVGGCQTLWKRLVGRRINCIVVPVSQDQGRWQGGYYAPL